MGDAATADAETVMDNAVTALSNLSGYTEIGFSVHRNTYLWELSWASSPSVSDYIDLIDQLATEADVDGVIPESPVRFESADLGYGNDVGMMWEGVQDQYAAHDIVGTEEAWRLLSTTYPEMQLGAVRVAALDSGLLYSTDGAGNYQLVDPYVTAVEYDGADWTEVALDDAVDKYRPDGAPSHGSQVAGILAAWNDRTPPWDGSDSESYGVSGLLAGVQQYGLDDDGDSSTDAEDGDGETFPFKVEVWNAHYDPITYDPLGYQSITWTKLQDAFDAMVALDDPPDIINLSIKMVVPPGGVKEALEYDDLFMFAVKSLGKLPASTLVVAGAGNDTPGCAIPRVDKCNALAWLVDGYARTGLVVAASAPGGQTPSDDDEKLGTLDGPEVDLAAPTMVHTIEDDGTALTYGLMSGTSAATPMVSGAAALVMAVGNDPSASASGITAADARSIVLDRAIDISDDWGTPRTRLDLFGAVLDAVEWADGLDRAVRIYGVDYDTDELIAQEVDPYDGSFIGSSADAVSTHCATPAGVEVDPRGDLVYVLCTGSPGTLEIYHASSLEYLDAVTLAGTIDITTELVATADGLVLVTSGTSSGKSATATTELWDPFDGADLGSVEAVSSQVDSVEGASALTHGRTVAFATYDGDSADGDGEQVAVLDLDVYNRDPADPLSSSVQDLSSISVGHIRDVDWYPGDDSLDVVFYDNSAGFEEIASIDDSATLLDYGDVLDATGSYDLNQHHAITTNPSGEDSLAYIGEFYDQNFVMTDITDSGIYYGDAYYSYGPTGSTTWYPRLAEFAQNGRFVAFGFSHNSTSSWGELSLFTIAHDSSASGSYSLATSGQAMSSYFKKLRGMAITPILSVLSPRPGKELSGKHRVYVLVRDDDIEEISYQLDGASTSDCPADSNIADGISDTCVLDTKGWTDSDDHVLEVIGRYTDGTEFSAYAR